MATVKTTLDTRRPKSDGTFNIIFRITHQRRVHTINSGISIAKSMWNAKKNTISAAHPNSTLLNIQLNEQYYKIQRILLELGEEFAIYRLRGMLEGKTKPQTSKTFQMFAQELIDNMMEVRRTGNAIVYQTAVNRLIGYTKRDISFKDIDYKLLDGFIHHLKASGLKQNSISNYLRSIRAIYNKAIKSKLVDRSYYPFYDISIKSERTAKRAISKADIARLNRLPIEKNTAPWRALNSFMLSFYLRGISFTDMAYLKPSNIIDGRVHYRRRKTHKNYRVKLFDPTKRIIEELSTPDSEYLLAVLPNGVIEDSIEAKKIINQWIKTTNKYLKRLGERTECSITITTYSSRHSFATIAKHLGYSNELIAEALGHEYGNKTTSIYLDVFDENKLDNMHYEVTNFDQALH